MDISATNMLSILWRSFVWQPSLKGQSERKIYHLSLDHLIHSLAVCHCEIVLPVSYLP